MSYPSIRAERGSALVMVLVFSALIMFLGGALLRYSLNEKQIAAYHEDEIALFYAAEAGLELGIAALKKDFNYREEMEGSLGEKEYTVKFEEISSAKRQVVSTAFQEEMDFTLTAMVEKSYYYENVLLVPEQLTLEDTHVHGCLHVNRELLIKGSSRVHPLEEEEPFSYTNLEDIKFLTPGAELAVGDNLYRDRQDFQNGSLQAPYLTLPFVNLNHLEPESALVLEGVGNYCFPRDLPPSFKPGSSMEIEGSLALCPGKGEFLDLEGVFYVGGDLNILSVKEAVLNLDAVFIVEGKVEVEGEVNRSGEENKISLIARDDIHISCKGEGLFLGGRWLIFSGNRINIHGCREEGTELEGALIAEKISLKNCNFYYHADIIKENEEYLPGIKANVSSWEETR